MKNTLVVTFSGLDQAGLVERLSTVVTSGGGNWERSRMTRLAGRFAGVLEVTVDAASVDALRSALSKLAGLTVQTDLVASPEGERQGKALFLQLTGQDRPGIVKELSAALASRGINIDELETDSESAPMSGEPLFHCSAHLHVPTGTRIQDLRQALEAVSQDLMVDIELEEGGQS